MGRREPRMGEPRSQWGRTKSRPARKRKMPPRIGPESPYAPTMPRKPYLCIHEPVLVLNQCLFTFSRTNSFPPANASQTGRTAAGPAAPPPPAVAPPPLEALESRLPPLSSLKSCTAAAEASRASSHMGGFNARGWCQDERERSRNRTQGTRKGAKQETHVHTTQAYRQQF